MSSRVTVRDIPIDNAGTVLKAVVEAGANQIDSVSYLCSTFDEKYQEALKMAIESAKIKAQAMAEAGGCQLGAVININELSSDQQPGLGAGISGGQTAGTGSGQGQAAGQIKVNINIASREELMTLTGIGQARADDIIRYRQEHGSFKRIEDIMKVSGIKEAAFQKIKDSITV